MEFNKDGWFDDCKWSIESRTKCPPIVKEITYHCPLCQFLNVGDIATYSLVVDIDDICIACGKHFIIRNAFVGTDQQLKDAKAIVAHWYGGD